MATTRGKGEGSIYKRASDGMWCASVELPPSLDNKRRRKVIVRKSKADCITAFREAQAELKKSGDLNTSTLTVEKWMTHWLNDIAPKKIRPKTLAGYRTVVNGYIIPLLGKKRLQKLTADDVRKLQAVMESTPKDPTLRGMSVLPPGTVMLSSTYALLAHNALSAALKVALKDGGKVSVNVCDLVDRPRARNAEQKALDVQQAIQLLRHLAGREDGPLWATYLLTGARRGGNTRPRSRPGNRRTGPLLAVATHHGHIESAQRLGVSTTRRHPLSESPKVQGWISHHPTRGASTFHSAARNRRQAGRARIHPQRAPMGP